MAKKKKDRKSTGTAREPRKCDTYEEVATYLLNQFASEFGLERVEPKQKVKGKVTSWTIDAKGVPAQGGGGIMVVECRRHTKQKASQEEMGGLAYRITDLGAGGGIYVSPLGMQEGAEAIAKDAGIISVTLTPDSTPHDFVIGFLGKFRAGSWMSMFMNGKAPDSNDAPDGNELKNEH